MSRYNALWQHKSGTVGWSDDYDSSRYAQAIKAKGPMKNEYIKKFEELKKSDSSVDDDEGWMTVKNQRNNIPGTAEEFEALANEWKEAGFDVRVQDLDESVDGAKWADIAVRKGENFEEKQAEEEEITVSPRLAEAKARAGQYEEDRVSGQMAKDLYDPENNPAEGFLERYKLKLGEKLPSGYYKPTPVEMSTNEIK